MYIYIFILLSIFFFLPYLNDLWALFVPSHNKRYNHPNQQYLFLTLSFYVPYFSFDYLNFYRLLYYFYFIFYILVTYSEHIIVFLSFFPLYNPLFFTSVYPPLNSSSNRTSIDNNGRKYCVR